MEEGDASRTYHRLTSYHPDREWTTAVDDPLVLGDFEPNDLSRLPPQVKGGYPAGLPVTPLPRDLPVVATPATDVLSGRAAAAGSGVLDLPTLARLLHLSAGVVRTSEHRARGLLLFRAAGSAGGKFPMELYVAARGVTGLADGVHWYDPVEHALVQIGPAPSGEATTVVVTGVPWRTGWRYSERGYRHIHWDSGTMLAQTLALAASAGLPALLRTEFPDAEVTRLVGADGVQEFPVALVSLAEGVPAIVPTGPAAEGTIAPEPLEFPLVTRTHRAGDGDRLGAPWPEGAAIDCPVPASPSLDEVILRRGSTRLFERGASLSREVFEWSMAAALRGVSEARPDPQFVAVHAVDGLEPGVYRWPRLDAPVVAGDLRDELERVCLGQGLGGDGAYVVMSAADLDATDDRGYRAAQLAAGIVEGRLHLAAYALGHGASGMTFLDSELPGLFGEDLAGLLFTCVGVPEYATSLGGRPGAPRMVTQKLSRLTEDG